MRVCMNLYQREAALVHMTGLADRELKSVQMLTVIIYMHFIGVPLHLLPLAICRGEYNLHPPHPLPHPHPSFTLDLALASWPVFG